MSSTIERKWHREKAGLVGYYQVNKMNKKGGKE